MRKRERHQLISNLVERERISTQRELVAALKQMGADVTQATVSRDMREMGVQKGTDRDGHMRYIMPPPQVRRDPVEVLTRVIRDSGAGASQAQNLVVVRSEPGTAPTVGRALDDLDSDDVVGTVAGDDTVLVVLPENARAREFAGFINDIAQGMD